MTSRTPKGETETTVAESDVEPTPLGHDVDEDQVHTGAMMGRYVILDRIGEGGMGVVYSAFDPELDRKLAVKLLHRSDERRRLIREAKAMARLTHPNVVTVLDVGWHHKRLWMAMEYIQGKTLKQWLAEQQPGWRTIIEYMSYAANGLAAAHAEGMVHRDFKPDNIMVADSGRVVVMDFGLVRRDSAGDDPPGTESSDDLDEVRALSSSHGSIDEDDLTRSGALLGTPAYMAPEQHMGRVVDARADQFAFCITLWEALYGQRPYAGKTSAALAAAVSAGQIVAPTSERGVPRRIRSILARGLAPSPRDRWPDMPSLVRALRDEPGRRRRWLGVGGALLTAGVAGAWWFGTQEACVGASEELAKAWNEERQQHVQAAFESADLPYGAQTFERVTQELDSWSAAWIASHRETCLSSQRQEQSPARLDARMRCLMAARQDLAATVDVLEKADREVVDRGLDLVWALPRPQRCERAQAENDSAILPSPEQQTAVEDLRAQLAAATAAKVAGQYERAIELALDVQTRAGEVGFEPLVLQAQAQHGELLELTGHPKRAREVFDGVLRDCVEREMWGVCTSVALQQIYVAGYRLSELQAALVYANLARAFNAKAQRDGVDVRVAVNLGSAYQRVGEPEEALSQFERAAELAASDPSVDASIRLQAETNRAFMLMELERLEDAESELRKIIEMRTAEFGADHPITSGSHINLGLFLAEHGRAAEGVKALERGLQIRVARLGPDHPLVASARIQLGAGLVAAGEDERAFDEFRRGYEATKKALGADHPQTAEALGNLSAQAFDAQDYEAAAEYTRTAIAALEASRGADTASTHLLHHNLGVIYREMGNLPAAEVELRDALERENRTVEAPAERGHTEHYLGLVLYEQGRLEEALAVLQRARAKNARPEVSNPRKADTLFALARVQLDAGRDRAEARALAEEARELLRDEDASETKAEIDAWLAAN